MLANPHWNAPSLSSFESWLETQDPSQTYPYVDCNNCAVAQYLKHVGKFEENWLRDADHESMMRRLNTLALGSAETDFDPSFGALLDRVRKARQFVTA